MATPSKQKQSALGLVELYKQEEMIKQQLEEVRQKRIEATRKQADEIRADVLVRLQDIVQMITPLIDDDMWSWRSTGEFDGVLIDLDLQPKEAKPIELSEEFKELVVGFLRSQPHGCDINKLAEGIKGKDGTPAYGVATLRQRMPKAVQDGICKSKKDGRSNIYFIE